MTPSESTVSGELSPPREGDRYFQLAGAGSHHTLFPGVTIRSTTCERMLLSVVTFEPDSIVTAHCHPHEQVGILVSGRLDFEVGDERRLLSAGDVWRIPGGVTHRVVAVGGPAVAVDVFTPVRDEYR